MTAEPQTTVKAALAKGRGGLRRAFAAARETQTEELPEGEILAWASATNENYNGVIVGVRPAGGETVQVCLDLKQAGALMANLVEALQLCIAYGDIAERPLPSKEAT